MSRSQRNFSEVREKSGKMEVEKSGHPVIPSFATYVSVYIFQNAFVKMLDSSFTIIYFTHHVFI